MSALQAEGKLELWARRCLAGLQISGGLIGIAVVSLAAMRSWGDWLNLVLFTCFGVVYLTALRAGEWLWRRDPRAIPFSTFVQVVQLPILSLPGMIYSLHVGARFGVVWTGGDVVLLGGVGSSFDVGWADRPAQWYAGMNLLSALSVLCLAYLDRRSQ